MLLDLGELGAVPGSDRLWTDILQGAVDRVHASGGGTVRVPAGLFRTGSFQLRSNVELHLAAGAVLQASGDLADYAVWPYHHEEWGDTRSLLFAQDAKNVSITGAGTIDLNDEPFLRWDVVKTDARFTPEEAARLSPEQVLEAPVEPGQRPNQCMVFARCANLTLRGVTVRRAPCWTITVVDSHRVLVDSIRIQNHRRTPNADGIHLCGCDGVVIQGCQLDCGDDCVAITGIASPETVIQNVVVTGCVLRSSSAGVRIGHEYSKVRNVLVANCIIADSNRGVGIFAGDDGFVEDVQLTGLNISTRIQAGQWWGKGEPLVLATYGQRGGRIDRVSISSVLSRADNSALLKRLNGTIRDVWIRDWHALVLDSANRRQFARHWDLEPAGFHEVRHPSEVQPWLVAEGVEGLLLERCAARALPPLDARSESPHLQDCR
ncbi:MAG: glycoside hydrolase family 28 protein [Fimbriimonadaceae bacterium]